MDARRLARTRKRFVTPFYLNSLNVDALKDPKSRAKLLKACAKLDRESARMLLTEKEWRGRMTAAWMIGINRWDEFVPQLSKQLIESEQVYAGQGYCVGLALNATEEAQSGLAAYLDKWLPELDCHYDQHWAMGALVEVDRARRTNVAARYQSDGGLWDRWLKAQSGWTTDGPARVTEIVSLLRAD